MNAILLFTLQRNFKVVYKEQHEKRLKVAKYFLQSTQADPSK